MRSATWGVDLLIGLLLHHPPLKIMKTTHFIARTTAILAATIGAASAAALDLTGSTTSGVINGAIFTVTDIGSTGSGVINPFVRLRGNPTSEGYNADARPVMPDVNTSGQFTNDLLLSSVPLVSVEGTYYYEFLLDINQEKSDPLLSLDKIQIYTRSTALTNASTLASLSGSSTLRYDLDAGVDSSVLMNYTRNPGSGYGDLFAYFPMSAFGDAAQTDYVYFYSAFGYTGDPYSNNDGFEEWAVREPGPRPPTERVPDGGTTLALLGLALSGLGIYRRAASKA